MNIIKKWIIFRSNIEKKYCGLIDKWWNESYPKLKPDE